MRNQKTLPPLPHVEPQDLMKELVSFLEDCAIQKKKPLIAIVGPTASGKTGLSIELAKAFNGEVISADSRQVYIGMDIGTAKISTKEMQGIPHHLIDVVRPDQEFTLADYKIRALNAIQSVHRKGKLPLIVGGTGLYISAICQNYQVPSVPPNLELRTRLEALAEEKGKEHIHTLLEEQDPDTAQRIHPNNLRYVIRALEIIAATGEKKNDRTGAPKFAVFSIGFDWPREELYEIINHRAKEQFECGLINETKTLIANGYSEKLPSMTSFGYLEIIRHLKGELTLEEAIELNQQSNRNYAKRQLTWFRRDKTIHWVHGYEREKLLAEIKALQQ